MRSTLALLLFLCGSIALAQDEEKPDAAAILAEQKKALEAIRTMLDLPKASIIETKNLWVFSTQPADKNKTIGEGLEKQYNLALTSLKFDDTDKNWQGKFGVYVFADRNEYTNFMTKVEKRGLPSRDETTYLKGAGDSLFLAVTVGRGEIGTDLERKAQIQLAIAMLQRKAGGVKLPGWMTDGFGRALVFRVYPQKYASDRSMMRNLARSRQLKEVWGEDWKDDTYLVATSFVDYLVFGPEKTKFIDLVKGLGPGENGRPAMVNEAMDNAKIDSKKVEANWRKFSATGK